MNQTVRTKSLAKPASLFEAEVEEEINDEVTPIDKPYDPRTVDITPHTLTISNIVRRLKEDAIDLSPNFQKKADLWDPQKQSLLIESILIRIPLPAFYFDSENGKWQVIDGLQRLTVIKNFIVSQSLNLTGLEYLNQFEGYSFSELPASYQRQIEETNIWVYILKSGTPDVKYNIFKRINTGGVALNQQEIRNAFYQGVPAEFVADLASSGVFQKVTRLSDQRMVDREFVTRFITFYLNKPEDYKPDLDKFMSNAMGKLNHLSQEELEKIRKNFINALFLAEKIFGKWVFRKVFDKKAKKLYPINKALFEVWSVLLSKLSDTERQTVLMKKEDIFDDFFRLLNKDDEFVGAITSQTDNKNKYSSFFSLSKRKKPS